MTLKKNIYPNVQKMFKCSLLTNIPLEETIDEIRTNELFKESETIEGLAK